LRGIQKDLQEFYAAGIRPVAISVDSPEQSKNLCGQAGYTFLFLSDPNAETIRRYDLLHVGGGPGNHDISRPAEFLVDRTGTVRWTNFTEDFRVRAKAVANHAHFGDGGLMRHMLVVRQFADQGSQQGRIGNRGGTNRDHGLCRRKPALRVRDYRPGKPVCRPPTSPPRLAA
jgi:hypothetical protein